MKPAFALSPLGTARAAVAQASPQPARTDDDDQALLDWLGPVQRRLASEFAIETEVAYLAWELARWPQGLDRAERKALVLLALSALVALRQGSTRLPLRGGEEEGPDLRREIAARLLDVDQDETDTVDAGDRLIASGRAGAVLGVAGEFKPLVVAGAYLYLQRMHALEERFTASLRARMNAGGPAPDESTLASALRAAQDRPAVREGKPIALSPGQAEAVRTALRYPLAVISGGPGTGKTTVVLAILRALSYLGVEPGDMVLAAPTGKSAHRLGQAVRSGLGAIAQPGPADMALADLGEPLTLHRLLGYSQTTGRFLMHGNNQLAARVVVVDEASMIDLVLMERLVRSLREEARLILLGDDHQLPSVEAGAVLRDLVAGESPLGPRAVRLTESYRMRPEDPDGRNILTVSLAIDAGTPPPFAAERTGDSVVRVQPSVAALTFRGVEFLETPEGANVLGPFLDRWHADVVRALPGFDALVNHEYVRGRDGFDSEDSSRLDSLFRHFDRARILCLTRVLPSGSESVNDALHRRALASRAGGFAAEWLPGTPLMMQINDYERMIFNGDQGLALRVRDGDGRRPLLMAVFPRDEGYDAFSIDSLRANLVRSYALTVHKAQGSEYDHVALVLPEADLPINVREVLYTALTRSRKAVTILGTRALFDSGVARRIERSSGVAEMLRARSP